MTLACLLFFLLVACARGEDEEGTATSPPVDTPTSSATPHASVTPRATETPEATPTPLQPALSAIEQVVDDEGQVVISDVFATEPGWIVVYADEGGRPGDVLGHAAVEEGAQQDVTITVDPYGVTPTLHALLHDDGGQPGTFEYPGQDEPVQVNGDPVATSFAVNVRVTIPAISVSDQELSQEGRVIVDSVTSAGSGWLALHADDDGEPGAVLGQTPVSSGDNEDVVVTFDWQQATRDLHAVLYEDAGTPGRFEAGGSDEAVVINGEPIRTTFTVTLPPDVFVMDQPVVTAEIVVERAFINGPGWLAIYSNYQGFTDRLLGFAPLEPGANEDVRVSIDPSISTDILHILLHEDSGVSGEFEYPAGDPPLRDEQGRPLLFTFQSDAGNYLITRDQPLGSEGTIVVPVVVTDVEAWVVVWSDDADGPGEIIGRTRVERGLQRDVTVTIDAERATETLHVFLHQDGGVLDEFEYPDGPDDVLQREGAAINAPFVLQSAP